MPAQNGTTPRGIGRVSIRTAVTVNGANLNMEKYQELQTAINRAINGPNTNPNVFFFGTPGNRGTVGFEAMLAVEAWREPRDPRNLGPGLRRASVCLDRRRQTNNAARVQETCNVTQTFDDDRAAAL